MLFYIIFLVCLGFECLQQWSCCKENLHVKSMSIEELASLAPTSVTNYWTCFAPINTMEEVNNFGKLESVEKDERSILEPKTHTMPLVGVINRGHLVFKSCHPYMHKRIPTWSNCLSVKDISTLSLMHLGYVPHLNFVPHCFFTILYVLVCCCLFCVSIHTFCCLPS